jgi:hypothetical protein
MPLILRSPCSGCRADEALPVDRYINNRVGDYFAIHSLRIALTAAFMNSLVPKVLESSRSSHRHRKTAAGVPTS